MRESLYLSEKFQTQTKRKLGKREMASVSMVAVPWETEKGLSTNELNILDKYDYVAFQKGK
jgi:DNA gyrase/topoisomerase IV subunit B